MDGMHTPSSSRLLNPEVRSANLFVFSGYWRTWSRVLREGNSREQINTVEVDLTPVNGFSESDWIETRLINVREHSTMRKPGDLIVEVLPEAVLETMRKWIDEGVIERLLNEDFLPNIDWEKYRHFSNGGAPFHVIAKHEEYWALIRLILVELLAERAGRAREAAGWSGRYPYLVACVSLNHPKRLRDSLFIRLGMKRFHPGLRPQSAPPNSLIILKNSP
jgi:hypothetical protein